MRSLLLAALLTLPASGEVKNVLFIISDDLKASAPGKEAGTPGLYALRTDRWAYMRYKGGEEELYDMEKDPSQFTNLARDKNPPAALVEMRDMLEARLK